MDLIAAWERDVRLLGELCVELASLGVKVRFTDTRPSLFVNCVGDDQLHRIAVGEDGQCFTWARGTNQHAATDVKGAASRIAAFVQRTVLPCPDLRPPQGSNLLESTTRTVPRAVWVADDPAELVKRLVGACKDADLEAVVLEPCTKVCVNLRAGTSLTAEIITLKPDADEVLCWWWSWNKPICPATDIDRAVATIADVISVVHP